MAPEWPPWGPQRAPPGSPGLLASPGTVLTTLCGCCSPPENHFCTKIKLRENANSPTNEFWPMIWNKRVKWKWSTSTIIIIKWWPTSHPREHIRNLVSWRLGVHIRYQCQRKAIGVTIFTFLKIQFILKGEVWRGGLCIFSWKCLAPKRYVTHTSKFRLLLS